LLFQSERDALSHARWAARSDGGTIHVHDVEGKLFKVIEIETNDSGEDGFVLPSI
jgi:hypothetical protein